MQMLLYTHDDEQKSFFNIPFRFHAASKCSVF